MRSPKKILVVDDDADLRRILTRNLTLHGFDVACAEDGISCMSQVRKEKPDLILLDLGMPAGDGFISLQRLRNHPESAITPIIVLTASDDEESRRRALAAGANAFVPKTGGGEALRLAVDKLLEPHRGSHAIPA